MNEVMTYELSSFVGLHRRPKAGQYEVRLHTDLSLSNGIYVHLKKSEFQTRSDIESPLPTGHYKVDKVVDVHKRGQPYVELSIVHSGTTYKIRVEKHWTMQRLSNFENAKGDYLTMDRCRLTGRYILCHGLIQEKKRRSWRAGPTHLVEQIEHKNRSLDPGNADIVKAMSSKLLANPDLQPKEVTDYKKRYKRLVLTLRSLINV